MIKFGKYKDIEELCDIFNIENYTINNKGLVDVRGSVVLAHLMSSPVWIDFYNDKGLKKGYLPPIKFGEVLGSFDCSNSGLVSLEGSPIKVGGFYCHRNNLSSLLGGPQFVSDSYDCSHNKLISLEGSPREVGSFFCARNGLKTLRGGPEIANVFSCRDNSLVNLEGSPHSVATIYDCASNILSTLEGCKVKVVDTFDCSNNQLNNLIGGPIETNRYYCSYNPSLYSIEGGPIINGDLVYFYKTPFEEIFYLFKDNISILEGNTELEQADWLYKLVKKSIEDYGFIKDNKIIKSRLYQALEEVADEFFLLPKKIKGYTYI